ncbi:MAG: hypothetical protein NC299_16275 [Lachnospiraceae bacterium]|nr:hypothetical protein [Ruminococcus sp.]MCM1276893.1 hypothetical protein [Lachnospiraceae bacterium]
MKLPNRKIKSENDLIKLVEQCGFLPFFRNEISGFSVEEHTPPELWFSDNADGPWEWKGPAAHSGKCVYGKLFCKKAGFMSAEWFPDLANYRRDGYDFDARYEDGLSAFKDKELYDIILNGKSMLSKEVKSVGGYGKDGKKGFETIITRLQMQTYINVADFEYMLDAHGNQYGWGVARYTTPEEQFGAEFVCSAYGREPSESKERIFEHLRGLLPNADERLLLKMIG